MIETLNSVNSPSTSCVWELVSIISVLSNGDSTKIQKCWLLTFACISLRVLFLWTFCYTICSNIPSRRLFRHIACIKSRSHNSAKLPAFVRRIKSQNLSYQERPWLCWLAKDVLPGTPFTPVGLIICHPLKKIFLYPEHFCKVGLFS